MELLSNGVREKYRGGEYPFISALFAASLYRTNHCCQIGGTTIPSLKVKGYT